MTFRPSFSPFHALYTVAAGDPATYEVTAMKQQTQAAGGNRSRDGHADLAEPIVQTLAPAPVCPDTGPLQAIERIKESLVFAFLSANLDIQNLPLKAFLDGFEKNILLACLRLTRGNQSDAAALLSLKPTALFEKMRKYGIRSQRGRLPGEAWDLLANGSDN
jgi:DNA-binding NtrC family response regulator